MNESQPQDSRRSGRRGFLRSSATLGAVTAASTLAASVSADDSSKATAANSNSETDPARPVIVGVMGLKRGLALAKAFAAQPNVQVKYVCDVDRSRRTAAEAELANLVDYPVTGCDDFRRILDDPQVDALVCAAPNHWHGPATITGCQAGKHVYVEKPACHNPHEGELMVQAAQRHQRVVQVGTQRRSNVAWIAAIQRLHEGLIGRTYLARSWYAALRGSVGHDQFVPVPEHLDYELWQGPAPRKPYSSAFVHYHWHWRWMYGNGELGNNGIHTLDLCRWGLGAEFPSQVSSGGGRFAFDDAQQTPDTQTVTYQFPDGKMASWEGTSCNRHQPGFVTFYGTDGTLEVDDNGSHRHFDRKGKLVTEYPGSSYSLRDHLANFLQAVRTGDASQLNCDVAVGHASTLLCHLGNIAHRHGRTLQCDPKSGRILDDEQAMQLWQREYHSGWEPRVS